MGTDKALLVVGGHPLAANTATALRIAGAEPVLAVGGDLRALRAVGLDAVPDDHPGEGPLGGIVTALRATRAEVTVVLACDLVAPDPGNVRRVVAGLGDADAAVPRHEGRLEVLHAAWRRRALPALESAFARGERAPHRALRDLDVAAVEGLGASGLVDTDTPGTLPPVDVPEIDVDELARRRADGRPVVDVRTGWEYEEAHLPGSLLIPMDELVERVDEIPDDGGEILVICRTGNRSLHASAWLRSQGIDAVNVAGGIVAWIDAEEPVVTGPEPG